MENRQKLSSFALYLLLPAALYACSKLNISFLWGTKHIYLTGASLIFPALGALVALPQTVLLVGAYFLTKVLLGFYSLTFGIPTLLATANWSLSLNKSSSYKHLISTSKALLQVILPITCMALFAAHPEGLKGFAYALYWLIPVGLFVREYLGKTSVFTTALSSTFIAHAVGSVFGLYAFNIPAATWLALIPVVALERLVFASATTLVYLGVQKIGHVITAKKNEDVKKPSTFLN